jgi:hypothetical protein
MNTYIREAFEQVCKDAKQPEKWYVILTECVSFYGGPEEGGWWGNDNIVIAYKEYPTEAAAKAAAVAVRQLAEELSQQSQREFGEQCLREMDWLDARGLDADFLPEPDGASKFYVTVAKEIPTDVYGCRQYC